MQVCGYDTPRHRDNTPQCNNFVVCKPQNIVNNVICEFESCHTIYFLLKATFYDSIYRHCVHA